MKDRYVAVLLEDINWKFDFLVEIVQPMQKDVMQLKEDVADLKNEMRLSNSRLILHDRMIRNHDKDIKRLKANSSIA